MCMEEQQLMNYTSSQTAGVKPAAQKKKPTNTGYIGGLLPCSWLPKMSDSENWLLDLSYD